MAYRVPIQPVYPVDAPLTHYAYCDIEIAQGYFDTRLRSEPWDRATEKDKWKALLDSTRRIDRLNFAGLRTWDWRLRMATQSDTGTLTINNILRPSEPQQPLEFPRNGDKDVPPEIIYACCEIALALLDGVDPEMEMQSLPSIHQGFAAVRETYDPATVRIAYRHGIPSYTAWNYLYPFLADPGEIIFRRVN